MASFKTVDVNLAGTLLGIAWDQLNKAGETCTLEIYIGRTKYRGLKL